MEEHASSDAQVPMESVRSQHVDSVNVEEMQAQQVLRIQETGSLNSLAQKILKRLDDLDITVLNIAVTGESGKGKSTFVNAIRGLGDEGKGSAPTGAVETTKKSDAYPYPNYPNVTLWDLPGIGTENFRADQYLEKVKFHQYDFFIIISSERFTSNDANLAREIHKMGKHFYFIRSKIDHVLRDEARKMNYSEKATLEKIRQDCITGLQKLDIKSPKVFLISSHDLQKYDFSEIQETLERDLSKEKRHVLLLALPNITRSIIQKKKELLQADIWRVAFISGVLSAVPIPGLGFAADVTILVKEISRYYIAFGLDDASLSSLSERVNVPVEDLKKAMKFELSQGITTDGVCKMLTKVSGEGWRLAEYVLSQIPILGSLPAGGIAYKTTSCMLQLCLDELEKDAHLVLSRVFPLEA